MATGCVTQNGPVSDTGSEIEKLEKRQCDVLAKLKQLQKDVDALSSKTAGSTSGGLVKASNTKPLKLTNKGVIEDIVINCSPSSRPLSLCILYELMKTRCRVLTASHLHSSINDSASLAKFNDLFVANGSSRLDHEVALTLIWKEMKHGPSMMVNAHSQSLICGEVNIARYIGRLLSIYDDDSSDIVTATEIDTCLELAGQIVTGSGKEKASAIRTLNVKLGKSRYLVGEEFSLADIVTWSAIHQSNQAESAPSNVKKWMKQCNALPQFQSAISCL
ncbi:aminoacyl tRNA synthase complex-interacting multifunctional protein 2-like isoform X2 [Tubulanus polymorphus]|uniref:aminoacyl tRNA synthase complex-interacting multifunctional protein 2-like isoform X2 n=1 Tax=Tubulanus polymorphus TaxID=672921 RepID=UPI003DA401B3